MKEQETIITVLAGEEVLIWLNKQTSLKTILQVTCNPKKYSIIYGCNLPEDTIINSNDLTRSLRKVINSEPHIKRSEITILNVDSYKKMILTELTNKQDL